MTLRLKSVAAAAVFAALAVAASPAQPAALVEPVLHLVAVREPGALRVALTLDACGGRTDTRILSALVDNNIPATIFISGLWLRHNADALAIMLSRPDLFELEDHGARHVPAIDTPTRVYGIAAAGSADAVTAEVETGAADLVRAGAPAPRWFRGATAKYTASSIALINGLGYRVAGFSINGDGGSLLGAVATERRVAAAKDGDIIIAHINQPTHPAGGGLVKGILALKARGAVFLRLNDAAERDDPTN